MSKKTITCPYCGSTKIAKQREYHSGEKVFFCEECECFFTETDIEVEEVRHKVSCLLNGTSEEHPLECDITVGEWDACGLSSLELPHIVKCYEMEGEGTMWFFIDGMDEDDWFEFDNFHIEDMKAILKYLEEN